MDVLVDKVIERPRLAKPKPREAFWIVLDPHRTGLIGGAFFGWLTALTYGVLSLIRWEPVFGPPQLVSTVLAFVVGYGGVGLFVYYLLRVGEREIPLPAIEQKPRRAKRNAESELPEDLAALNLAGGEGIPPETALMPELADAQTLETPKDES